MVDLRREFKNLIENYGSYYLIVKANRQRECKCVDQLYKTPKKECPICLGTGFINAVEKIKGRDTMSSMPVSLPRIGEMAEPGVISIPARDFYLEYTARPEAQDLLIICEWNGLRPIFDEYTEIHRIGYVQPLRGDNGRIEYFLASAEGQLIKEKAILHNIGVNADKINYYITVR
jgi:hypothetical protein